MHIVVTQHAKGRLLERAGIKEENLPNFVMKTLQNSEEIFKPNATAIHSLINHDFEVVRYFYNAAANVIFVLNDDLNTVITVYKARDCKWFQTRKRLGL